MAAAKSEPAIDTLRRFAYRVDELQSFRLFEQGGLRSSLNISAAQIGAPVSIGHHEPDNDDLRSYLMAFRKFLLKRDPTFIGYVFGIAHRHITNEEFVARLAAAREKWNDAMKKGNVVYKVNDDQLTPELVMDLWINGGYFHDDLEKDGRLQELVRVPMSRWLFLDSVVTASKVIRLAGRVVKVALREGMVSPTPVR